MSTGMSKHTYGQEERTRNDVGLRQVVEPTARFSPEEGLREDRPSALRAFRDRENLAGETRRWSPRWSGRRERAMGGVNDMTMNRTLCTSSILGLAVLLSALVAGCGQVSPYYCPEPTPGGCQWFCDDNSQCAGSKVPVCDQPAGVCVQCTDGDRAACTGSTPACVENACAPCTEHAQCGSNVCKPDGGCADPSEVAYASDRGTDNVDCTKERPCTRVSAALETLKPYVKLSGTFYEPVNVNVSRVVTMLADPGATLSGTRILTQDSTLQLGSGSQVLIYDLEISGSQMANGIRTPVGNAILELHRVSVLNNQLSGISMDTGSLRMVECRISGNKGSGVRSTTADVTIERSVFSANGGGVSIGVSMAPAASNSTLLTVKQSIFLGNGGGIRSFGTQFDITNNIIANNGDQDENAIGGVALAAEGGTQRFEFNTVVNNLYHEGVRCTSSSGIMPVFPNNIVYGNSPRQISGCVWTYSNIGPGADTPGIGNKNVDPLFVDPANGDYHLQAASLLENAADPSATTMIDIDGDPRPQDVAPDIGADEIRAP